MTVNGDVHTIDGGAGNDILTIFLDEYIDGGTEDNGKDTITSTKATTPSTAVLVMI